MIYPVSETFESFQGEGVHAGTSMFFIRLAGCTVGRPYTVERREELRPGGMPDPLPIYAEECTLYDGRKIPCDTDYRKKERVDEKELARRVPENYKYVCITGGEPLMHELKPLIQELLLYGKYIHIETSGSKSVQDCLKRNSKVWITVSPKTGFCFEMMAHADEFKFLVDKEFYPERTFSLKEGMEVSPLYLATRTPTFLQPVNFEHEVNAENLKLCVEIQRKFPVFRLSPQYHKLISHYIRETIR